MNFIERKNPTTTLTYAKEIVPSVTISERAMAQMFIYTKEVQDEVGWLGTAFKNGRDIHIEETFLFDQEVHATTTEITPEGLEKFAMELLSTPEGASKWNDIKMWGHSHVNMGVTPSGQDDKQMEEFSRIGHDFFVRLICNKKGELRIDVYLYEDGLVFKDVPWKALNNENPTLKALEKQMEELKKQAVLLQEHIQTVKDETVTGMEEPIKAEIKEKVKKFAVKATNYTGGNHYGQGVWWHKKVDIMLADWFAESEILYLKANVKNMFQFQQVAKELGIGSSLTYGEMKSMYDELMEL